MAKIVYKKIKVQNKSIKKPSVAKAGRV